MMYRPSPTPRSSGSTGLSSERAHRLRCPFQPGYHDLAHAIHRRRGGGRAGRVRVAEQLVEPVRHDLPTQAKAVLEPAALRFLAAVGQSLPVIVDLVLVLAV